MTYTPWTLHPYPECGLNAARLLFDVREQLPPGAQIRLAPGLMAATVSGTLPELCRAADALERRFLHHSQSYDELYLCQRGRSTWLYLSTQADRSLNQLRTGIVNFNTNKLPLSRFTVA